MKSKYLWIVLVVVAALSATAAVLWHRGRRIRIAARYRLNRNQLVYIHDENLMPDQYFDGTLDSVWVPYFYTTVPKGNTEFVPIKAVGVQDESGKVKRVKLEGKKYIESYLIGK